MQERAQRRDIGIGKIRVPVIAGRRRADIFTVHHLGGEHLDFRDAWHLALGLDMDVERPEAAAERGLLLRRQILIAEHQYVMGQERVVDRGEGSVVYVGQIEASDLGAQYFGKGCNLHLNSIL